jgi:hypothetical protein
MALALLALLQRGTILRRIELSPKQMMACLPQMENQRK